MVPFFWVIIAAVAAVMITLPIDLRKRTRRTIVIVYAVCGVICLIFAIWFLNTYEISITSGGA